MRGEEGGGGGGSFVINTECRNKNKSGKQVSIIKHCEQSESFGTWPRREVDNLKAVLVESTKCMVHWIITRMKTQKMKNIERLQTSAENEFHKRTEEKEKGEKAKRFHQGTP